MTRKLKRKIERAAQKAAPVAVDEEALIERSAAFSAAINEWGAPLLATTATMSDAVAASLGDFAGQVWNVASGDGAVDEIVATLVRSWPTASVDGGAEETGPRVRELVTSRRDRFSGEKRLVEAVVVQHLGGKRFYLALPVGWDDALG